MLLLVLYCTINVLEMFNMLCWFLSLNFLCESLQKGLSCVSLNVIMFDIYIVQVETTDERLMTLAMTEPTSIVEAHTTQPQPTIDEQECNMKNEEQENLTPANYENIVISDERRDRTDSTTSSSSSSPSNSDSSSEDKDVSDDKNNSVSENRSFTATDDISEPIANNNNNDTNERTSNEEELPKEDNSLT